MGRLSRTGTLPERFRNPGSSLRHIWTPEQLFQELMMLTRDLCAAGSVHRDRTVLHCQFCGKRGHAHNFMRSKRFCSTSCARG